MEKNDCITLLKRKNCSSHVIAHCEAVADLALKIASYINGVDEQIIFLGAMLHDIGRGVTHDADHAYKGAQIAEQEGFKSEVTDIIRTHLGGGSLLVSSF